ncbi:MAG TPA: hypothetical protein VFQ43_19005 [Nitrososphaera sp.]|nr:hypothetical protein [Nitrososphaera sp.]
MIARLETSVLKEIVYLDPELNGDAEYLRVRFRPVTAWSMVRPLVFSPCVASLMGFVVLLIIGVNQ